MRSVFCVMALALGIAVFALTAVHGQNAGTPSARLAAAPRLQFPGEVDSNTPFVWSLVDGAWRLTSVTSWGGEAKLSEGASLEAMPSAQPVQVVGHPGHGVWIESVIPDEAGVWYGYYHHEVPGAACGRPDRQIPSLGALRSSDRGRTWEDLGQLLEAPADSHACASTNRYVLGGVGDVSAVLDRDRQFLYLYYSQYVRETRAQGVAVARLSWASRDEPVGRVDIWVDGAWLPARAVEVEPANAEDIGGDATVRWDYPVGTPLIPATRSWHDGGATADAYWGPSIHWNTYLEQWVMLLHRARNEQFDQEGLYVSFSTDVGNPRSWSVPTKVVDQGGWYPQVVGLESGEGTDKVAGRRARFFVTGRSSQIIEFSR